MKLSIKLAFVAALCSCLTMTSVSEAGKFFGRINGGSQFKSRHVRKPSTANFHHNFNYKKRGGSSKSSRSFMNDKKPTTLRNTSSNSSRLKSMKSNSQMKTIGSNSRMSTVNDLNKFENIRKPIIQNSAKKPGLFDGRKPGQNGWKTIMPINPELGVHKPNPGFGGDIVFPRPRPRPPIFCLPPINICPPVYTPCVTRVCGPVVGGPVIVEQPVVEAPVQEDLQPVMQLVVGQPAALEAQGLGMTVGQVVFEVNGLGLPAKVTLWEDKQLGMEVPMMGLQGPTKALMHLIDANGQPLSSVPVELLMEVPAAE